MVINVCLPQFKPRIHCNKISADGYEVENLISEDLARRNRGFRSEYFIKPPVHVTISFPFNIEICRINIDISAGGYQTFSGLELYTSTSCNKSSWQSPEGQFSGVPGQPVSDKDTFTLVGKAVLKNQSKVTFGHRGFKPRPPFQQMENVLSYPGSASQDLWNKGPSSLSNVSHLKICITHVAGGGLPGIKRLEVWGQPAKSCPQDVIEGVFQVASQLSSQEASGLKAEAWTPMESDCVPLGANESERQTLHKLVDVVQDIPEEFLDPITLEIMTFPMLLPSGKVIDQTTLEKCNRSEACWGRVPSDPFTGVAFGQHSQPLPHPTLKARIDHFLLQHSIPGTNLLGRAHASHTLLPSSIAMASLKRKVDCMDQSSPQPPYFSSTNSLVASTSENSAKKMKPDTDSLLIHMDCSTDPVSHEQKLSESLDTALTSALSSMPSFTAKLMKSQLQAQGEGGCSSSWSPGTILEHGRSSQSLGCGSCGKTFSCYFKAEPMYQLPCGHLLCRGCLAEKQKAAGSVPCGSCKRPAATHDIRRVHF
ncbi:RING finger protein 37 isoform X3 [Colius striatus]|uniref:RING finger protein 37 isoform X3 n=1 Tax=Colius striatus TaxID=57412 RepID=UPI002B1CF951|nr:RING finger protein 37 isoform X3 [Colius striatus]XP_061848353.1 RING finger protein 37 isoform X3 [Colius striatus]XP_061848354.1 RING finger protein 37 isoform X3 [Colius striatus]XP_061848355.1 RING finger protein 37 isoform X3 [Colius striatus]XP_061848356.1 RING finger protein 37 isoform X3 [Colius striatus]